MDSTASEIDRFLVLPFWKSTCAVFTRRELLQHVPKDAWVRAFKRGKKIKRRAALASRMSKSDDS